jgi:hypothetical protein
MSRSCVMRVWELEERDETDKDEQVAQIIPLPAVEKQVQELNQAIPAWAASKNSTASPIWVVDQWTNFTSADLKDGIHPSESGDVKMANKFYPALVHAIATLDGNGVRV